MGLTSGRKKNKAVNANVISDSNKSSFLNLLIQRNLEKETQL